MFVYANIQFTFNDKFFQWHFSLCSVFFFLLSWSLLSFRSVLLLCRSTLHIVIDVNSIRLANMMGCIDLIGRYINSVRNVPRVARYLARFIRFLIENGVDMENIHLIGFSLGAEVAGFAGKTLKEWNLELPRITGEFICGKCFFFFFCFRLGSGSMTALKMHGR